MKIKTLALSAPLRLVWTVLLLFAVNAVLNRLNIARSAPGSESVAWVYRNFVVALGVLWVSLRFLEGKRLADAGLSLRSAPRGLAAGVLLGAVLITMVVGVLAIVGSYRIEGFFPLAPGTSRSGRLGMITGILFLAAMSEEVKLRAILFRLLEQSVGTWVAISLSALAFGFIHWNNAGATVWSSLAIAFEGGVLLAALYAATRSLWLPIGAHWGWNVFEGSIWGVAVSGHGAGAWLQGALTGPTWMTGGIFGPEAGVPALVVGCISGVLAMVWMVRRGQVQSGPWARWRHPSVRPELGPTVPAETPRSEPTEDLRPGA